MAVSTAVAASGGVKQYVQTFSSTGTFTAPSNCSSVQLFLVGGGGGGGGAGVTITTNTEYSASGGGGGGGAVWQGTVTVTPEIGRAHV